MSVLFDTNLLIDHARGHERALRTILNHPGANISVITRIELLAGPVDQEANGRRLLKWFHIIGLDDKIADAAAVVRRTLGLKLPDAVILATAQVHDLTLLTRDERGFGGLIDIQVPYRL